MGASFTKFFKKLFKIQLKLNLGCETKFLKKTKQEY